jgi:phage tail tape-measure protein
MMGNFQEMLNAQTEDGKYEILAQLLSRELKQFKKAPRS